MLCQLRAILLRAMPMAAACGFLVFQFVSCGSTNPPLAGVSPAASPKTLTPEEVSAYLEDPSNLFFLDVREDYEIADSGSIAGYVHIPIGQLESRLDEIPKDKLIITA